MSHRTRLALAMATLLVSACGNDATNTLTDGGTTLTDGSTTSTDSGALPSCDSVCPAVLAPKCAHGPVSQSDCVSGCETVRASKCADKYRALYDCGGATPVYACDSQGRSGVVGCESASDALYACTATL